VENDTVFHYSMHAVVLNYCMQAGSLLQMLGPTFATQLDW